MHDLAKVCEESARLAGKVLLDWRGRFLVQEKGRFDLVTEADVAAQKAIHGHIRASFPEHGFLGEEDTGAGNFENLPQQGYCWVVDPLDGTTNYVHGLKNYCTSVALCLDREVIVGAVFAPESNDCYTAIRNQGAWLNGDPIQVSGIQSLSESLVACGFAPGVTADSVEARVFLDLLDRTQSIRRLGSAALNLCYVAAGQLDAYWALSVKPWDVAAGLLVVAESGGILSAPEGGTVDLQHPRLISASTEALRQELSQIIRCHWPK
ncbi:MAG: inositol monophosphatase [Pirellulaceae bacterium]|nr:inositol monophosphatase [Pirellulaceae bacterium]